MFFTRSRSCGPAHFSDKDAWQRRVEVERLPVCHPDDIIASEAAANRVKDRESLPRLRAFRDYWKSRR